MYLNIDHINDTLSSLITYTNSNSSSSSSSTSTSTSSSIPKLYIDHVAFISFKSRTDGSILYANSSIMSTFNSCVFTNTTATNGGSLYFNNNINSTITITSCQFINNNAKMYGGAIYFDSNNYHINILSSTFYRNTAVVGGAAILLYSNNKNINILHTKFIANTVPIYTNISKGYNGGSAILFSTNNHASIYIYNSTFISNSANYGITYIDITNIITTNNKSLLLLYRWCCTINSPRYDYQYDF